MTLPKSPGSGEKYPRKVHGIFNPLTQSRGASSYGGTEQRKVSSQFREDSLTDI